MTSNILQIGKSGALAARAALDATAQNIANAGTAGYVRRSVTQAEVSATSAYGTVGDISLSGVRITGLTRNVDAFRQGEARRTGSDAARADAEVAGLEQVNAALETSNLYPAITDFEAALAKLAAQPTDNALRATALASAGNLAQSFNLASTSLSAAGAGLAATASDGAQSVNTLAGSLAALNLKLASDPDPASNQATLLDQRDHLLSQLSQLADVTTTFAPNNMVSVQLGGSSGPLLVSAGSASPFASSAAADGSISYTLGGSAVTLGGGSLAGTRQAAASLAQTRSGLDALAAALATAANGAQTGGVARDGSAGQPLFTGTTAASLRLALTNPAQLATAPAGAGANSRDGSQLAALRTALSTAGVASGADALLFASASAVQQATTTRDALDAIATNAKTALDAQAGVSLDQEAANLLKFQQAFQASGKVMQVAGTLFDSLLQLR